MAITNERLLVTAEKILLETDVDNTVSILRDLIAEAEQPQTPEEYVRAIQRLISQVDFLWGLKLELGHPPT